MKNAITLFLLVLTVTGIKAQTGREVDLDSAQLETFKEQAVRTVKDLGIHIGKMVDPKLKALPELQSSNIDYTVKLFASEKNVVEVTSIDNSATPLVYRRPIRVYFTRLSSLPYKSVNLSWYDIYISSTFKKGDDNKYYGTASFCQTFDATMGFESQPWKIHDHTCKNIQIIIEQDEVKQGFDTVTRWVLKLGDIKVTDSK